jgi:glycosyltransferase 2 family protein
VHERTETSQPRDPIGLERLGRRLLVPLTLGLLALVGLLLVADAREVAGHLRTFDPWLLVPVLALSLVNYFLRFVRWQAYLRALGVSLPRGRSLGVFLVGFLLSVTPGKAGELGKAWLVRELGGGPALRVIPAVLAERVTDLLGVILLLGLGALVFPGGVAFLAAAVAVVVAAVLLISWRAAAELFFRQLERVRFLRRRVPALREMLDLLRGLLSPGLLAGALLLSVVAWGAEGIGFFLVIREYAPEAGVLPAVFNYTASTFLGGVSMVPGGLLAAEGSLTALLAAAGLGTAAAASATLIIRAATLWFAVLLGLLALPFVLRRLQPRSAR